MNFKIDVKKFFLAFCGVFLMGIGVGLNCKAGFGNDPISVFYDGVRNFFGIDMGVASTIINSILLLLMFIFFRSKLNIGTFIYTLTLGIFIDVGMKISMWSLTSIAVLNAVFGCIFIFLGTSIYIAIDFGLDTWSGLTLLISEKLKKNYKYVKVFIDVICVLIGFIMGGAVGVTTIAAAFLGGPVINFLSDKIKRYGV